MKKSRKSFLLAMMAILMDGIGNQGTYAEYGLESVGPWT